MKPSWQRQRLGSTYEVRDQRAGAEAKCLPLMSVSQTRGVVPRSELVGDSGRAEHLSGYKVCQPGDIVLNRMSAYNGALGVARERGVVSPDYLVMAPRGTAWPDFVAAWLKTPIGIFEMTSRLRGIGSAETAQVRTPRVNESDLRTISLKIPPFEEQRAIADYLDRETARIDTLIDEQQRLIELLRERRKAVVEQAVFSGLESAQMSNNAEPWLPSTPSHWQVVQLGLVSDTLAGYAFSSDGFSEDEGHVRLLRGVNIKPGRIDWNEAIYWEQKSAPVPNEFLLEIGDLAFGMDRPFVGGGVRIAALSGEDLPALLVQRVMRIRPHPNATPGYIRYVISTDSFFRYLAPLFTGISVPHVSEWQVRKFKLPLPPLDEQRRIVLHLSGQTAKIDTLIAEAERFIELSRDRRSALITAAVTGQIDVREVA